MSDEPKTAHHALVSASTSAPGAYAREYGLGVLKGLVAAIPFAGGLLNEVLFEARSRLKQERLETFLSDLGEAVARLGNDKVDHDFLASEEFSDLAEDVLTRVARNRSETKRGHFQNLLLKSITGVRPPDFSSLFLNLLEEISDDELRVYENYYKALLILRGRRSEGVKVQVGPLDYTAQELMGLPPLLFKQVIQSLIRKGLVFDDSFGRFETPAHTIVQSTELGAAFFEWIAPEGVATSWSPVESKS